MVFRWWYDELKSLFHKILDREHRGRKEAQIKATCSNAVNAWLAVDTINLWIRKSEQERLIFCCLEGFETRQCMDSALSYMVVSELGGSTSHGNCFRQGMQSFESRVQSILALVGRLYPFRGRLPRGFWPRAYGSRSRCKYRQVMTSFTHTFGVIESLQPAK